MSDVVFLKIKKHEVGEVQRIVHKAMDVGEYKKYIHGPKIFVKINGISDQLVPGQCSSPWVVDGVLSKLRQDFPDAEIYMGDANLAAAEQLNRASQIWGHRDLAKKYNVTFVNLSEQPTVEVDVGGKIFKKLPLPKILVDVDTILNVPVAKTHCLTDITCTLKNHWGMVPRFRHQYHLVADQCIADINFYFKKTAFNVVDGTIMMEGNAPRTGIPRVEDVIIAGADRVAIDYTVAKYMGFDADKVGHIARAEEMGVGSRKNIRLIGDVNDFKIQNFKKPEPDKQPIFFWEMHLRKVPVVKQIIFDTPIFRIFSEIATLYNTKVWYNIHGKKYTKQILETSWYRAEFEDLVKRESEIK